MSEGDNNRSLWRDTQNSSPMPQRKACKGVGDMGCSEIGRGND